MRRNIFGSLSTYTAMFAAAAVTLFTISASAQVPVSLTQQGRLLDDSGQPITGQKQLTFSIYDARTGGNAVWQESISVQLDDQGFYNVTLGGPNKPIDASVLEGGNRWLGISVGGAAELKPRVKLNSVPSEVISTLL